MRSFFILISFFSAAASKGLTTALALILLTAPARADGEGPLTQGDIDAYVFLVPRLDIMKYPDEAAKVLNEAKLTRRRAIYITTKIPLTQALARGLVSPKQLMDIPLHLHPTTEEVQLVNANLKTLMQAESVAIDLAGRAKAPPKRRGASRP